MTLPRQVDLLILKVVSESRVPILVFLGLSVLELGLCMPNRQTSDVTRAHHCLIPPTQGAGHNNNTLMWCYIHFKVEQKIQRPQTSAKAIELALHAVQYCSCSTMVKFL